MALSSGTVALVGFSLVTFPHPSPTPPPFSLALQSLLLTGALRHEPLEAGSPESTTLHEGEPQRQPMSVVSEEVSWETWKELGPQRHLLNVRGMNKCPRRRCLLTEGRGSPGTLPSAPSVCQASRQVQGTRASSLSGTSQRSWVVSALPPSWPSDFSTPVPVFGVGGGVALARALSCDRSAGSA